MGRFAQSHRRGGTRRYGAPPDRTATDPPTRADITVYQTGDGQLTWTNLLWPGDAMGWQVRFKQVGDSDWFLVSDQRPGTSLVVDELNENLDVLYQVAFKAAIHTWGNWSDTVDFDWNA